MSISVDYSISPWLITIPKADLTLDTGTKYNLDVDTFWQLLRDYADSDEGIAYPNIYNRIPATSSTPSITDVNLDYYELQFEDGSYSVNIINGNTNIRDAEVKNTVSVNTNNTTGFISAKFLQHGTFGNAVTVNAITGKDGVEYPIGTPSEPCKTSDNTLAILDENGLTNVVVKTDFSIANTDFSAGYAFIGASPLRVLTGVASANLANCSFHDITVTGELDGMNLMRGCSIDAVTNASGRIENCYLMSTMTINGRTSIVGSYSDIEGGGYPLVTVLSGSLIVRDFHGSLGLGGITSGNHSIGIDNGGRLIIEATCTGGSIYIRGNPFEIIDNSGAGCTVIDQTESAKVRELYQLQGLDIDNPMTVTPTSRVAGGISQTISGDGKTTSTVTRT